jgi:amino acid permease
MMASSEHDTRRFDSESKEEKGEVDHDEYAGDKGPASEGEGLQRLLQARHIQVIYISKHLSKPHC